MLEGLSNLLAGSFKGTGLYLGILLAGLGAIIILATVFWRKKEGINSPGYRIATNTFENNQDAIWAYIRMTELKE